MDVLSARCCGLDRHKREIVACLLTPGTDGTLAQAIRAFGTMTADILALADWLTAHEVTHVAMERTGVSWKPIWNLLEEQFELVLVNARHVKAVPGRKTDVRDGEWLADLLQHGSLSGSFVPDRPQREQRELTRYRTSLVRERTAESNRLQKTREGANIKRASVATDLLGTSGRAMLAALVAGEGDGAELAQLAHGRLRDKIPQLEQALVGDFGSHQRFLVAQQLAHSDFLDERITQVSGEIGARVRPDEEAIARLDTIPGVGRSVAEGLVAELGTDLTRFPTAKHLASWAGLCPGNHERAGCPLGDAPQRQDAQRQPLTPGVPGAGGARRSPYQGHVSGGAGAALGGPPRPGEGGGGRRPREGGGGRRPRHPDHRLPPVDGGNGVRRPGRQLLRRAGSPGGGTAPRAPPGRVGVQGIPGPGSLAIRGGMPFSDQAGLVSAPTPGAHRDPPWVFPTTLGSTLAIQWRSSARGGGRSAATAWARAAAAAPSARRVSSTASLV
jgi:transposase